MGKFDSKRDELLHQLTVEGWSDDSTGSVEAPTGHLSLLEITTPDLGEAYLQKVENVDGIKREELLGIWILTENSQGFVSVQRYDTPEESGAVFQAADKAYGDWLVSDEQA